MCVIMYKAKDLKTPDLATLKKCWDKNPHGAGVIIKNEKNQISYVKGLMDFTSLTHMLYNGEEEDLELYKNCELAIHFRIQTHGGINSFLTHPFLIQKEHTPIYGVNIKTPILMHNGIFNIPVKDKKQSDTSTVASIILPCVKDDELRYKVLEDIAGFSNRVLIMYPKKKETEMIGTWHDVFKDGILYSNTYIGVTTPVTTYIPTTTRSTTSYTGGKYHTRRYDYYNDEYYETRGYSSYVTNPYTPFKTDDNKTTPLNSDLPAVKKEEDKDNKILQLVKDDKKEVPKTEEKVIKCDWCSDVIDDKDDKPYGYKDEHYTLCLNCHEAYIAN